MSIEFLYLSHEDVIQTGIDMTSFLEIVEKHFVLFNGGDVILPDKVVLDLGERERGRINALTAYVGGDVDVCGVKWVASFPQNKYRYDLPRASAIIILNDSTSGIPLAVIDGTYISAMRTGAVAGVGAKYLSKTNARSLCLIGCGVQARTQLLAVTTAIKTIREVKCFDIDEGSMNYFVEQVAQIDELSETRVIANSSVREAVTGSDIVITATIADEPIVNNDMLDKGSLVIHIGSYQEEDEDVIYNSDKVIVDDWNSVLHRRTPILARMYMEKKISEEDIYGDLGEIVAGKKSGRENDSEQIFFLPIGMGSEDVIAAYRVYEIAIQEQLGRRLSLWEKFF